MAAACTAVAMDDPHWTQVDDWLDMSLSSSEMVHVCFNVALLEMFLLLYIMCFNVCCCLIFSAKSYLQVHHWFFSTVSYTFMPNKIIT